MFMVGYAQQDVLVMVIPVRGITHVISADIFKLNPKQNEKANQETQPEQNNYFKSQPVEMNKKVGGSLSKCHPTGGQTRNGNTCNGHNTCGYTCHVTDPVTCLYTCI
jgi:hypothetical protein